MAKSKSMGCKGCGMTNRVVKEMIITLNSPSESPEPPETFYILKEDGYKLKTQSNNKLIQE